MANATNLITEPHPNTVSKGAVEFGPQLISKKYGIWAGLIANGAPVNGVNGTATFANMGSTLCDATTGKWYSNRSVTAGSPTWTEFNNA